MEIVQAIPYHSHRSIVLSASAYSNVASQACLEGLPYITK